ncbi:MAG: sugar phosphate isomerase/epimerase family protein [Verrucomicrobiales bacterium]|nr:sugar phosphate isomerase/epimerase family protein [Verrucomicrobiota bacterium JB025]
MNRTISVCTWSLRNDLERVTEVMKHSTLTGLHLEISAADAFRDAIQSNGWQISSTMVGFPQENYSSLETIRETGGIIPDAEWPKNRELALAAIGKTAEMGVKFLSTHAGFIDHNDAAGYRKFLDRMKELADAAAEAGITLILETGQETAEDLKHFLADLGHPAVGVNFDPANMILYGKGDPIEAIGVLAPWIKHVHIKDATASPVAGKWGAEVPWGTGDVDTAAFYQALDAINYRGAVAIEREAGDQREADITHAANLLEQAP